MYVSSMTYEPFSGGAFEASVMFHVGLARKGQLFFEPVDLYRTLQEKATQIGNVTNYVYFQIPEGVSADELEEILQLFGTLKDNGIGIVAESSAYYRPAWLHMVDYMIAACGNEKPLPYASNELRYYPEGDELYYVQGHPNAVHYLVLRKKMDSNKVMQFIAKTGYKLITPKLFRYKVVFIEDEGEYHDERSEENRDTRDRSGAVVFGDDPFYIPKEGEQ